MAIRKTLIASAVLHGAIIMAATIAWPHRMVVPPDSPPIVPVDLVTIADTTNIAPQATQPPLPPAPAPAPTPPPAPEEKAELAPTPEKPPKPAKIKPDKPDKKETFNVNSILALLDDQKKPAPQVVAQTPKATQNFLGAGAETALTMSEMDALLAQIRQCWNVPAGAPHPEQLIVQVRVFLTVDGHLAQPPQLTPESRAAGDANPFMRAAGDAALRAISVCEPYKLPADKYDSWREILMTFDPTKMLGG